MTVATVNGVVHVSRVRDVDLTDQIPVPLDAVPARSGPAALVLITRGGAYDQGVGYRGNVVVTAVPDA